MFDSSPEENFDKHSFSSPIVNFRIGVTGHRELKNPDLICSAIHDALKQIEDWFTGHPYSIEILTQLADGTDRLAARCIMDRVQNCGPHPAGRTAPASGRSRKTPHVENPPLAAHLSAILPMAPDVYCHSFLKVKETAYDGPPCDPDQPSVREFHDLLKHARTLVIAPLPQESTGGVPAQVYKERANRHDAYRRAGNYVVDNSDFLLVVWNGKKESRDGSTYQIYRYALESGRSMAVIGSETGKIEWSVSGDDLAAQYFSYRVYRDELSKAVATEADIDRRYSDLLTAADAANLSKEGFQSLRKHVLPRFLRARNLAAQYQEKYYQCGQIGYASAALAVCIAALLSLVFRDLVSNRFYAFEAICILTAGISGWLLKHRGWQRKWIDYRFLAERLRATCYLYIAGIDFEPAPEYPDTQFHWLPAGWVTIELREVWRKLPLLRPDAARFSEPTQVQALASFLFHSWIQNQQEYYQNASKKNREKNESYERISICILVLSFLIAAGNAVSKWFYEGLDLPALLREAPHFLASALPAITGALAGVMIFRHYARNAERYSSMSQFLRASGTRMLDLAGLSGNQKQKPDLAALRREVQIADRNMAHEHEGWRTVFGVRLPGPG